MNILWILQDNEYLHRRQVDKLEGKSPMNHLQSYPRERSHRGILPERNNGSSSGNASGDPNGSPAGVAYPFSPPFGSIGNSRSTSSAAFTTPQRGKDEGRLHDSNSYSISSNNVSYVNCNGGANNNNTAAAAPSPPLLAYTYSPLEHSSTAAGGSVFDHWQQLPGAAAANAAANGLTDVVLGETARGDGAGGVGGVASVGAGGDSQSRTYRLAVKRTIVSVLASLGFGFGVMVFRGRQLGLEFLAGYLVEQSLSEFIVEVYWLCAGVLVCCWVDTRLLEQRSTFGS